MKVDGSVIYGGVNWHRKHTKMMAILGAMMRLFCVQICGIQLGRLLVSLTDENRARAVEKVGDGRGFVVAVFRPHAEQSICKLHLNGNMPSGASAWGDALGRCHLIA